MTLDMASGMGTNGVCVVGDVLFSCFNGSIIESTLFLNARFLCFLGHYSTHKCPSGEKTVIARSYLAILEKRSEVPFLEREKGGKKAFPRVFFSRRRVNHASSSVALTSRPFPSLSSSSSSSSCSASLVFSSLSGVFRFSLIGCTYPLRVTRASRERNRNEERALRKQKERKKETAPSTTRFGWFFSTSTSKGFFSFPTTQPKKKTRCGSFGARGCPRARPGTGAAPRAKGRS